jgi:PilZ domain
MILAYLLRMRSPTRHFKRKVRRARHIRARVVQPGYPDQECDVMDISQNGAKIVVEKGSRISTRFELAFGADSRRACDLVWRRGNTLGVRFFA